MGGYRGRLIWPCLAEIAPLDISATAGDPDGAGPLTTGYDEDFAEPVLVPPDPTLAGAPRGADARQEGKLLRVPIQFEPGSMEVLQQFMSGNSPSSAVTVTMHFRDLERLNLVDKATGEPKIRVNDRLHAIRHIRTKKLIQTIRTPPGLYVTEVTPTSYGLSGLQRNLLLVAFEERELSTAA